MVCMSLVSLNGDRSITHFFGVWNEAIGGKVNLATFRGQHGKLSRFCSATQTNLSAGVSRLCILFQPRSLINALKWMASMQI